MKKWKKIGFEAFKEIPVEEVYIPDGVEKIEDSAFYNCRKLRNVEISNSVVYIGENAFAYCEELKKNRTSAYD